MPSSLLAKVNLAITPALLFLGSLVGVIAFGWPLIVTNASGISTSLAPVLTAVIISIALLVVLTAISAGSLNSKSIALLGLLSALIAAARVIGAHAFGVEPMWAFIVIAGRALGPVIGFSAGSLGMASSALITGGIGPWLPFQMFAAGWVGLLAGLIPISRNKFEIPLLAIYGAISAVAVGLLLNLWFWPTAAVGDLAIAFVPGESIGTNLVKLVSFSVVTSLSFDIPRAVITFMIVLVVARPMLRTLRRITRPAQFVAEVK